MQIRKLVGVIAIVSMVGCSRGPSAPTSTATVERPAVAADGSVGADAVSTERIQLRRSGGAAIITPALVTGQTLDVPLNVELDVWAEIRRLESDRARLIVDWGNGNNDFTGCGSCRLTNTYTRTGRYILTARVVDLNAPFGSAPIASATVTLNVIDFAELERFTCATVTEDFESFPPAPLVPFPLNLPALTIESSGTGDTNNTFNPPTYPTSAPELINRAGVSRGDLILTFASDKNTFEMGLSVFAGDALKFTAYDSKGTPVASGPLAISIPSPGFFNVTKGFMRFSSPPFRRIVVQFNGTPSVVAMWLDNIRASCQ